MKHLLLIAALAAVLPLAGLLSTQDVLATTTMIHFDARVNGGPCSVHGDSGTLAQVTVDKTDGEGPFTQNEFLCRLNCSDLDCFEQGDLFLHYNTRLDGFKNPPNGLWYNFEVIAARGPHTCNYVGGNLIAEAGWGHGNSHFESIGYVEGDGISIDVIGQSCYDTDGDEAVGGLDIYKTTACFGDYKDGSGTWGHAPPATGCRLADHNADKAVTGLDTFRVIAAFGLYCEHPITHERTFECPEL